MAHVEQQVLDAIKAALTGLATTGASVHLDWPKGRELPASAVPCLRIADAGTEIKRATVSYPRGQDRAIDIVIEGVANSAAQARQIMAEVETKLTADIRLGGLLKDLYLADVQPTDVDGDSGKPLSGKAMLWRAVCRTAENAPNQAIA